MATVNTFTSYASKDVGTTPAVILSGAADTQTTLIGFTLANTSASPITVSVYVTTGGVNYYLVNNATIPVGGSLALFGADGKLVLNTGDAFTVVSSAANSADVIVSALQIT